MYFHIDPQKRMYLLEHNEKLSSERSTWSKRVRDNQQSRNQAMDLKKTAGDIPECDILLTPKFTTAVNSGHRASISSIEELGNSKPPVRVPYHRRKTF